MILSTVHMPRLSWPKLAPWLLLSLASITLLAVTVKHRALRESHLEHRRADMRVQRGDYLSVFRGRTVSGDSLSIGETRQVLFYLTSTCPFCRATLPSWQDIAARLDATQASRRRVQVVAVTTDSFHVATRYSLTNGLAFPLLPLPTWKFKSLYRAFSVPQTLVSDADGRIVFVRHGVINTVGAIDSVVAAALAADSVGSHPTVVAP